MQEPANNLSFKKSDITITSADRFLQANYPLPSLKKVWLTRVRFDTQETRTRFLSKFISEQQALSSIVLNCELTDADITLLSNSVVQNKNLKFIDLRGNHLSKTALQSLSTAIRGSNPSLQLILDPSQMEQFTTICVSVEKLKEIKSGDRVQTDEMYNRNSGDVQKMKLEIESRLYASILRAKEIYLNFRIPDNTRPINEEKDSDDKQNCLEIIYDCTKILRIPCALEFDFTAIYDELSQMFTPLDNFPLMRRALINISIGFLNNCPLVLGYERRRQTYSYIHKLKELGSEHYKEELLKYYQLILNIIYTSDPSIFGSPGVLRFWYRELFEQLQSDRADLGEMESSALYYVYASISLNLHIIPLLVPRSERQKWLDCVEEASKCKHVSGLVQVIRSLMLQYSPQKNTYPLELLMGLLDEYSKFSLSKYPKIINPDNYPHSYLTIQHLSLAFGVILPESHTTSIRAVLAIQSNPQEEVTKENNEVKELRSFIMSTQEILDNKISIVRPIDMYNAICGLIAKYPHCEKLFKQGYITYPEYGELKDEIISKINLFMQRLGQEKNLGAAHFPYKQLFDVLSQFNETVQSPIIRDAAKNLRQQASPYMVTASVDVHAALYNIRNPLPERGAASKPSSISSYSARDGKGAQSRRAP